MVDITYVETKTTIHTGIGNYTEILKKIANNLSLSHEKIVPVYLSHYPFFLKPVASKIIHITHQQLAFPLYWMSKNQRKKTIVTVHDIIPLQYPLYNQANHLRWKSLDLLFFKKSISAISRANYVLCDSLATKKALISLISYPEEKIFVVYPSVSSHFSNVHTKRNPYDILYVGSEMPHKNVEILIDAIAQVKQQIPSVRLIKIGYPQWPGAREKLIERAIKQGISETIIWKDAVEDIKKEYNCATLFVHPSLHEGFGYPIVEAMACGCPVLCSGRDSLSEIAGSAAEYFNPESAKDLAKKIIEILNNRQKQKKMQKKGLQHVKKFNQQYFENEMKKIYTSLL